MRKVVTLSEPLVRRFLWSLDKRRPLDSVGGIDGMSLIEARVLMPENDDSYPNLVLTWEGK